MKQFYSYLWLREDDSPYYAGKGFGIRAYKSAKGHRPPADLSKIVIFPQDSEADAFESEMALIALFGRKDLGTGCLRNFTDGGEGTAGRKPSAETLRKISEGTSKAQKGQKHTPEHVEKVAAANRGRKRSPEHIAKVANWHRTHSQTPEWKAKVELSKRGRIYSSEALANMSAAQKGHAPTFLGQKHTPEAIAKQSAARKAYWARRRENAA